MNPTGMAEVLWERDEGVNHAMPLRYHHRGSAPRKGLRYSSCMDMDPTTHTEMPVIEFGCRPEAEDVVDEWFQGTEPIPFPYVDPRAVQFEEALELLEVAFAVTVQNVPVNRIANFSQYATQPYLALPAHKAA